MRSCRLKPQFLALPLLPVSTCFQFPLSCLSPPTPCLSSLLAGLTQTLLPPIHVLEGTLFTANSHYLWGKPRSHSHGCQTSAVLRWGLPRGLLLTALPAAPGAEFHRLGQGQGTALQLARLRLIWVVLLFRASRALFAPLRVAGGARALRVFLDLTALQSRLGWFSPSGPCCLISAVGLCTR